MKVLLINGSPHEKGSTYTALAEIGKTLKAEGIDSEIFQIGKGPVRGCIACNYCKAEGHKGCAFNDDKANELREAIEASDGVIIGSPVYFAGPNGALLALLDRAFYSSKARFENKPGASIVVLRRGGASSSFDRLNKYFLIRNMPIVPSQYWNSVHGCSAEEVRQDLEGMQTMRNLAHNMAWMLRAFEHADGPKRESVKIGTNFIR